MTAKSIANTTKERNMPTTKCKVRLQTKQSANKNKSTSATGEGASATGSYNNICVKQHAYQIIKYCISSDLLRYTQVE